VYVILGDLNICVSARGANNDKCQRVRGPCELGIVIDDNGDMFNILLLNEATICNMWFQKKNIHKQT